MGYEIDIPKLFNVQFGIAMLRPPLTRFLQEKELYRFHGGKVDQAMTEGNAVSYMGTPVWDYVKIEKQTIEGTGKTFAGYDFPLETVVQATRPKNIVETEVVAKDGEVEELMSLSNWELELKGFVINYEADQYPEAQVKALKQACELKDTQLKVEGTFLSTVLKIYNISIHELELKPMPGYARVQAFKIEARGIVPYSIDKNNGVLL